ncbi:DUF4920 domain-containing protein [Pseudoflavitalea sp. X16]|uniref:DUF4920 domain-containing protein n=1 Tax=Paraflavitalea devenefica TaxID=2716334 RepID=UPI00141D8CF4|nr:DUF4920 domain-containing protein [Paraflavitalea devenefica]NII28096.1 DUF4920 domain-containing protein [Paraflavitalea devenefica]
MKQLLLLVVAATTLSLAQAQPPKGPANPGDVYGAKTTSNGAVDIATLPAKLAKKDSLQTKVIAKVLDVCPKKGCWMKVQVNDSTTAFVKMKDYAFFVPLDVIGKTVVLDTEAKMKTTSVDELKHYAEDAKKPQAEIDAITEPKKEIRLLANGILVLK